MPERTLGARIRSRSSQAANNPFMPRHDPGRKHPIHQGLSTSDSARQPARVTYEDRHQLFGSSE